MTDRGPVLPGCISGELDWKQSSRDSSQSFHKECQCHKMQFSPLCHYTGPPARYFFNNLKVNVLFLTRSAASEELAELVLATAPLGIHKGRKTAQGLACR